MRAEGRENDFFGHRRDVLPHRRPQRNSNEPARFSEGVACRNYRVLPKTSVSSYWSSCSRPAAYCISSPAKPIRRPFRQTGRCGARRSPSAAFSRSWALLGLCISRTRRAAGIGLFLLTVAVTPANVYMYLRADLFPQVSASLLFWRLPLQLLLLGLIWRVAIKPAREMGHCVNALSALSKRRANENPGRPEGQ